MDRKSWIGLILSVVGLISWVYYSKTYAPSIQHVAGSTLPASSVAAMPTTSPGEIAATPNATPILSSVPPVPRLSSENATLQSSVADYLFVNDTGGISKVVISQHRAENGTAVTLNNDARFPIGAIGLNPNVPLEGFVMTADASAHTATFTRTTESGIQITKRFLVPASKEKADQYQVQLELSFHNPTSASVSWPSYWVGLGGAAPLHHTDLPTYTQFDWSIGNKATAIDVNWFDGSRIPLLGIETRVPALIYRQIASSLAWASVSSQYFCTILNSLNSAGSGVWASRSPLPDTPKLNGILGGMELPGFNIAPGQTVTQSFLIYSGPKELHRLQALGKGQDSLLKYGPFKIVSEGLLWGMNKFYKWFGNYAWAIIVLTLVIKLCLWPLQNKATQAMRRMSALTPKMTELREKYRDDPQKMNEEMMKLYREYGVNPFGGCFPMLIQIPIFFGFYSMLGTSIELRDSSFLWIHDLSQPDTVAHILGIPINLLPIVMAGTMVWQMAITPKSGDAVQQRIFYFMPVIFLAFCYNYASGLALYWTTQNLFSIVQLYLTRNQPLPKLEKKGVNERRIAGKTKRKGL